MARLLLGLRITFFSFMGLYYIFISKVMGAGERKFQVSSLKKKRVVNTESLLNDIGYF